MRDRACLVAPAGYGKTEVIAKSVALHTPDRQLVLTHTHAGVRALRTRLARFGATYEDFHLDTIAGFSLRYAASFPKLSEIPTLTPTTSADWNAVYTGATRLFRHPRISGVIGRSFGGLYVDEYQDCSPLQHELVLALADIVPCRIVGDPLQGIFDFSESIVDWDKDVFPHFERIDDLTTPWRWVGANRDLGEWLDDVREHLLNGEAIDLDHSAIKWVNSTDLPMQISECQAMSEQQSVVAIRQWPSQCHAIAQKLGGTYASMEEVESKDLLTWTAKLEAAEGPARVAVLIDFAGRCMTGLRTPLSGFRRKFSTGEIPDPSRIRRNREVLDALIEVATSSSFGTCIAAIDAINKMEGRSVYRPELWAEMRNTLALCLSEPLEEPLRATAWRVRDRGRQKGRRLDKRVISRTLLIKGLEFDHAVLLDATEPTRRNLYVALTRGAQSLTVLAPEQMLIPAD